MVLDALDKLGRQTGTASPFWRLCWETNIKQRGHMYTALANCYKGKVQDTQKGYNKVKLCTFQWMLE